MPNDINDQKEQLSTISYQEIYDAIYGVISKLEISTKNGSILFAKNLYQICKDLVNHLEKKVSNQFFQKMCMDESAISNFVTLNFKDKDREHKQLQELMIEMKKLLKDQNIYPEANWLSEIISEENVNHKGFTIKMNNQMRNVSFSKLKYNDFYQLSERSVLRHDSVKISFKLDHLLGSIKQSLIRYIQTYPDLDEFSKELVIEQIQSEDVGADEIHRFILENRFTTIKRASIFLYLDYLLSSMTTKFREKYQKEIKWLQNYVRRYELLEKLCIQFLKEIRYEPIEILDETRDILNSFRYKDMYDFLPIIGVLSPLMASTQDTDKCIEQYGISLKLNGEVYNAKVKDAQGKRSFNYHVEKIRELVNKGDDEEYFDSNEEIVKQFWGRAIEIVLLKFFLFHLDNDNYDPTQVFERDLDHIARANGSTSLKEVYKWYCDLAETLLEQTEEVKQIERQLEAVREMLRDFLDPNLNRINEHVTTKIYKRRLTLLKSILGPKLFEPDRKTLLRNELDTHNYKYTILTKDVLDDSLFSFEYEIEFSNSYLCSTTHQEKMSFKNKIEKNDKAVVVMFLPVYLNNGKVKKEVLGYTKQIPHIRKICIPYPEVPNFKSSLQQFLFLFVYKLIVYLFLSAYIEPFAEKKKSLFISFWHFHKSENNDYTKMDTHIRQFSKELEFLFGMNHNTGSQGFDFGSKAQLQKYKVDPSHYSMYCNVPKQFALDIPIQIPKIAIVVITSFKTDTQKRGDQYLTGVFGEIYTVESNLKQCIFSRYGTFFYHGNENIYKRPDILIGIIKKLYEEGYKQILYIARVPYTTKFLNKRDEPNEMYFMNRDLIESLHFSSDISVYPIHYTITKAFEARSSKSKRKNAFFVDHTSHIQKNLYRNHRGIVPVLQVYSGNELKGNEKRHVYNSLITYQTWSRNYNDEVINNKIQSGVINPDGIKPDLIRALLLFHTSQYASKYNIIVKIDPYSRLLGDDGVIKKSVLEIAFGKKKFKINLLAYFSYLHTKVFAKRKKEEMSQ